MESLFSEGRTFVTSHSINKLTRKLFQLHKLYEIFKKVVANEKNSDRLRFEKFARDIWNSVVKIWFSFEKLIKKHLVGNFKWRNFHGDSNLKVLHYQILSADHDVIHAPSTIKDSVWIQPDTDGKNRKKDGENKRTRSKSKITIIVFNF